MDPITHTLVGASLAESGLKRLSPLATATLVIGANAPDIDAIAMFMGRDVSLGFRRGWTHGILAIIVLPLVVAGVIMTFDRLRRRLQRSDSPPVSARPIVGLAYLAVLSHPALDWLNTYGIRLLMPFDGRWFYGDALFIVDPWIWLLAGAAVVLRYTRTPYGTAGWILAAGAASWLVLTNPAAPGAARIVWTLGIASLVGIRVWGGLQRRTSRLAATCLAALFVYISSMVIGSHVARMQVRCWLADEAIAVKSIMAGPVPANPFVRDVIVEATDGYYFLRVDWLADERVRVSDPAIPVANVGPIVQAALEAAHVRGTLRWLRFPSYDVEQVDTGYRVIIRDVRFARRGGGLGRAQVDLDHQLNIKRPDLADD